MNSFGNKWQRNFRHRWLLQTWRNAHRNIEKDDVVLVEDHYTVGRSRKLGNIREVYPGQNGLVRDVAVEIVAKHGVRTCLSRQI